MRLDIYRRPESNGHYSYLAVPEGKQIPEEAISVDWEEADRGVEMADGQSSLDDFAIEDPLTQISAKGYAITSIKTLGDPTPMP
ncbi:MAG: hypothetical protein EOP02_04765 [Proteobacteria bacterium]|nr:MAG: hypothetical protein EOP02_04765 [Pseudomonadota bacterium]